MFTWRQLRGIATVALLSGLLGASLARAQPLGFTIDPTQGFAGDTVTGQVNPADVAASCVTDLAEFQAEFEALFTGPYASGAAEEISSTGFSLRASSSSTTWTRRPTASRVSSCWESGRTSWVPPRPRCPRPS